MTEAIPSFEEFTARQGPRRRLSAVGLDDLIPPPPKGPKVLFYDIETSPALAWVWEAYDTNIIAVEREWSLLSFAYKWQGIDDTGFVSIFQSPKFKPDKCEDMHVARRLAVLLDQCDVSAAHNGDKFDRRKANARFLANGLDPPSPYKSVDTLKMARREFNHLKNGLDYLGDLYGLGTKMKHHGFPLWRGCMAGSEDAWKVMEEYNRRDVSLLEDLFYVLAPWTPPGSSLLPNLAHFGASDEVLCSICLGAKMTLKGTIRTVVSEFRTWQCQTCRGYSRSRFRVSQRATGGVRTL